MENNNAILNVNLEDLPDDQKALIEQAAEEFKEKCLLSYSRTRESVVQKTPLPRVLLHGQSDPYEEAEARLVAQMIHNTVNEVITNHNQTLANTVGNVIKTVFFGAPIDQIGLAYFSGFNPSAVESNVPSSSQQANSGQYQQPPAQ